MKIINLFAVLFCTGLFYGSASACIESEIENNDDESRANDELCNNTVVSGNLGRDDIDWFQISAAQPGTVSLSLDHHQRDDFDIELFAETGPALASALSSRVPETLSFNVAIAGTYYIKLSPYRGRGWYDLSLQFPDGGGGASDCGYGERPSVPAQLSHWLTGTGDDQCASSSETALLLMGGGTDVDAAFTEQVGPHIGLQKDIVVLRTSGSDGYNDYLYGLLNADSVETLLVDRRSLADSAYVDWVVRSAEFVFVAGGDQSDYLNQWQGTALQSALQHVVDKGGVVGGTSAGMALMASSVYDPDGVAGAISDEVVLDPCHSSLNFSNAFLQVPMLDRFLTDTHFRERDRMGRAMASLATHAPDYRLIAASENTSLFVEASGEASAAGSGEVYVLRESAYTDRVQVQCGVELIYRDVERVRLLAGDRYDFNSDSHDGDIIDISVDGNYRRYYTPRDPY